MSKVLIKTSLFLLCLLSATTVFSQSSEDYDYTREIVWGINKNTNGGLIGGVIFKYSQALTPTTFQSFGLELMNVKHPKEARYVHYNGNSYIYGKQNYLYSVRLQYGREKVFFKKAPQQGVQISGIIAAGPTIGVIAPYYVQVYVDRNSYETVTVPYNPRTVQNQNDIAGTGGIFQGLNESDVTIGLNLKASLSFEFGAFKNNVSGFEAGFIVEGFPKEVILMPGADNNKVFTSAFITLLFGSRR